LREWLIAQGTVIAVTSTPARVEVPRAVGGGGQEAIARTRTLLAWLTQLRLTSGLRWFIAYDKRLLDAAKALGLPIVAPGAS
jgi:hypothetical protein